MTQFQIRKDDLNRTRIVELRDEDKIVRDGEILVRVERFGFSANNVTYAVMGEAMKYLQFFPASGDDGDEWGILPVWGFAVVTKSKADGIAPGERLFGYFPPATHLVMKPDNLSATHFFDAAAHRLQLPKGYNLYRRVEAEPGYDQAGDNLRMLLYPLYITSFCLWDALADNNWYGAEQIIIVSASSKTSLGLAQALKADPTAPKQIGLTSKRNQQFVDGLNLYDDCTTYDELEKTIEKSPSVIVDMSGNSQVLGRLHKHLGNAMLYSINVGLTHWDVERGNEDINRERSEIFFAPGHIQKRMKDWGPAEFSSKSTAFINEAVAKSSSWLNLQTIEGLTGLESVYNQVRDGQSSPQSGIIVEI